MKVFPVRVFSCCVVLLAASCRPVAAPSIPTPVPIPPLVPAPLPPPNPKLPPVRDVRGPLQISVTYPKPDQMLTVRDSNFIFGSVGTGDAALQINGVAVPVFSKRPLIGVLSLPSRPPPHF